MGRREEGVESTFARRRDRKNGHERGEMDGEVEDGRDGNPLGLDEQRAVQRLDAPCDERLAPLELDELRLHDDELHGEGANVSVSYRNIAGIEEMKTHLIRTRRRLVPQRQSRRHANFLW
jgi:hypothetical protein